MCDCSSSRPCPPAHITACREALGELMEIGMHLARLVRDRVDADLAPAAALPIEKASVAFEQVARTVRRTVRMMQWLEHDVPVQRRVTARKEIIRAVEDGIDREAAAGEADALHAEMLERLDSLDLEDDVAGRPPAEIVREILDDLGLGAASGFRRARRRRREDVAVLHARAAAPAGEARAVAGAPFGGGRPEWSGVFEGDISKLSDEELDRLCGDVDSG